MSIIQIQKKKQLTFEEICPEWSKEIPQRLTYSDYFSRKTPGLDINNFQCCIVGEAHGFNMGYVDKYAPNGCEECHKHSMSLSCMENLDKKIESFTQHWNEVHLNK